jgi:3-methyladenine DNA glycosylase AlkD
MTVDQIMKELERKGSEQTRKIFARHGASGDKLFGVKVADLKGIAKKIKGDQELALKLYATGNYDAQYLAGLVADGKQMSRKQLEGWAKNAGWQMISEYTVPWVAAENEHGLALANQWIKSRDEGIAACGWNTYAGLVSMIPDDQLDLEEIEAHLQAIAAGIGGAKNRVRYAMNSFVIAVGACVAPLNKKAKAVAKKLGKVEVDMGETACKVPLALDYIEKVEKAGRAGKKRKTIRC